MPRYNHDPSQFQASLTIFPKGEYEFEIVNVKPFERTAKAGHQSYGIRFGLQCTEGPMAGKKAMYSIYLQSDGGAQMGKRFQIAVYGLNVNEANEKKFDEWAVAQDWAYNPEDGELGEGWKSYKGKRVKAAVDVENLKDDTGQEVIRNGETVPSQQWTQFMAIA